MPKVSIIVPCYNVEKYLDRCVNSLIHQTLTDVEIILVDDESPDSVPVMCDEYAKKDPRIKVVHKKNAGLGMACNSGIEIASGDYIAFCDSDDFVDLDCYESLYNKALSSNSDAVYSGIKRIDQDDNVTPMSVPKCNKSYRGDDLTEFMLGMIATTITDEQERARQMSAKIVLYSKAIIDEYNIRFKSERQYVSEDLLFNLDFLQYCSCVSEISEAYYYYYVNNQSLSQTLRKDRFEKYLFLRKFILSNYRISPDSQEFRNRVNKMFIGYVRSAMRQIVNSSESYKEKRRLLTKICSDNIWEEIDYESPTNELPLAKRIIYWMTRYNFPSLIHLAFSMKRL